MCETCLAHQEWREAVEKLSPPIGGSNVMPKGYLKTEQMLTEAQAQQIRDRWENAMKNGQIVILGSGITFVPFEKNSPLDPSIVICGHCGQWAAVQTECAHCGAQVI